MKMTVAAAVACLLLGVSAAQESSASIRHFELNIPKQDLAAALKDFAEQTGLQVALLANSVDGATLVGPVAGNLTLAEALQTLLSDQGLAYKIVNDRTIAIVAAPAVKGKNGNEGAAVKDKEAQKESGFWGRLRVADAGAADGEVKDEGAQSVAKLDEVVVTAQKREERLQDVPVPVTALNADTLVSSNKLRLQDYYNEVPGLTLTPDFYGAPQLTIRGLSTGSSTNPTVGITVDDVPFGSSSALTGGWASPDIDPSDLARVEVLRGPQGTLYGANSLGGLLKFVTLDPSLDVLKGNLQAGATGVRNGDQAGYNVRGSVSVPLGATTALRVSGFTRTDPGYVDNVLTGERAVNRSKADGGSLMALWRPSEAFSLKMSALLQHNATDGSSMVEPGFGDLKQGLVRGAGQSSHDTQVYSAIVTAKLGQVNVTSVTGYSVLKLAQSYDASTLLGDTIQNGVPGSDFGGFGVSGAVLFGRVTTSKFTQELRFSGQAGNEVEWLVGGFYNYEDSSRGYGNMYATVPVTGQLVGTILRAEFPSTYTEMAEFADMTFHITQRVDVQVGGRVSKNRQTYKETDSGPYVPLFENSPSPFVYPEVHTKDSSFTYLVTPRLKLSSDCMIYARLASGYRAGGPNIAFGSFAFPATYKPDKTQNYEIGFKGDVLDRSVSLDASLYYIDWKDIQLSVLNSYNAIPYYANGSRAKSKGIELSIESRPLTGLRVSGWVALGDAKLTEDLPVGSAVLGVSGDRLPYSARFTGNVSVEDSFPLAGHVKGFVGGTLSYFGDRQSSFASVFSGSPKRQDLPAYTKLDFRAGAIVDSWTLSVFVNNVADRRAVLDAGPDLIPSDGVFYTQPRTVGVLVSRDF